MEWSHAWTFSGKQFYNRLPRYARNDVKRGKFTFLTLVLQLSDKLKIISLNTGISKTVTWRGKDVKTGIFKSPVDRPIFLAKPMW